MDSASVAQISNDISQPVRSRDRREVIGQWLTFERAVYCAAIVVAASLRIVQLGAAPLTPLEAAATWSSWLAANGLHVENAPIATSALHSSLQTFVFWLGADGDVAARLPAALVGLMLCLLPWWWRPVIGRSGALIATILFTIDPWLLTFSRYASGAVLSITLCAVVLTACVWIRYHQVERARTVDDNQTNNERQLGLRVAAIAFGLLLVSGPVAWNLLIPLLVSLYLVARDVLFALFRNRTNLLFMVAAAILGATLWLARLSGIGLVSVSLTIWLDQFRSAASNIPVAYAAERTTLEWALLRIVVDQPLLWLFGVVGLGIIAHRAYVQRDLHLHRVEHSQLLANWEVAMALGFWLVWGTFLLLLPGRSAFSLPVLYVPLAAGAIYTLATLWEAKPTGTQMLETATVGMALLVLSTSCLFWLTSLVSQVQFDTVVLQAAGTILAVELILLVLFGYWVGKSVAIWLACSWLGVILLGLQLSSSWKLSFDHTLSHPDGFFVQVSSPEVRMLRDDVRTLSAQRTGDPTALQVQVQYGAAVPATAPAEELVETGPDPLLGWYLRDMQRLNWVLAPQLAFDNAGMSAAITPRAANLGDSAGMALPAHFYPVHEQLDVLYVGSNYQVRVVWLPVFLGRLLVSDGVNNARSEQGSVTSGDNGVTFDQRWTQQIRPLLRWMWYREANLEPAYDDVILWAAADVP